MKLLYWTVEWHGLTKLRMHIQTTLEHLESLTKEYGYLMRNFHDSTCLMFKTKELPWEINAQRQTQQCAQARKLSIRSDLISEPQQMKKFNLFTLKFHALGDYVH